MKIALVSTSPPFRGGISDHNESLYHKLSKNHKVEIFSFSYLYPKIFFPGKSQKFSNNQKLNNTHFLINTINPISWIKTANKIKKFNPDIVIFSFWNPFVGFSLACIARLIKSKIGMKKIFSICHNIKPHEQSWIDKKLIKFYTNSFEKFIFMSSFVEKELDQFKKSYKSIVRYLPINDSVDKKHDKIKLRYENGHSPKDKIMLFAGLIRPYKGIDNLLNGTKNFLKENKDSKLIIAGEAYESLDKYKLIINEHDIKNRVIWISKFLSNQEIERLMIMSDLLILPYKSASQSGIISQAWKYNLPVIANDVGGLPEYIVDGKSGYVVKYNSISSLSKKIYNFFNSNDKIDMPKFIELNKDKFSWDYYISGIWELIDES